MTDFRKLLGTLADDVKKPEPLPQGQYLANITKWETFESSLQKTPGIKVSMNLVAPGPDVAEGELIAAGGAEAVAKRKMSMNFYLTDDATYRLKEFLEGPCSIDMTGRSFAEALPEIVGVSIMVTISHRLTEKQEIRMEINGAARAE